MRIDSHNHFWQFDPQKDEWITDEMSVLRQDFHPSEFKKVLKENRIDGAVAVQADQSEKETHYLLSLAKEYEEIAGVVGWVDLRSDNIAERLDLLSPFKKLVGFRHIVQAEPDEKFMLRKDFQHGISCLERYNYTYDILIYPNQIKSATQFVKQFPNQKFVVDHLAKPYISKGLIDDWQKDLNILADHPNVSCKISGMITEADWKNWKYEQIVPYLEVAVDTFGVDRLMYGSDWPVCLLAADYRKVLQIVEQYFQSFSENEKIKVFGQNAINFYGLTIPKS